MRILERPSTRLAPRVDIPLRGRVTCALDGGDGTARVGRRGPFRRRRSPHARAQVTAMEVARQESDATDTTPVLHVPVRVLRSGERPPRTGAGERGGAASAGRIRTSLHAR